MHRLQELVRLHRLGRSDRDISRLLRMGRDTIRGYAESLTKAGLLEGGADVLPATEVLAAAVREHLGVAPPPPQQRSTVEAWREEIDRQRKKGAEPTAIHDWLKLNRAGYAGSLSAVKRLCRRMALADGPRAGDVAIRVETAPGKVAQVDFAYAGLRYDPLRALVRKSWLFLMTLGFSRHQFADLVFDQTSETWIRLHVAAFAHFGGVPEAVVPDNLKAAVVRAAFGVSSDPVLHRTYRELARHYGFQIDPAPPRSPEKKGKVERNVRYVRTSFLSTHDSVDIEVDRRALERWVREVAGVRRHGTTGRAPLELFAEQEREALLPLPAARFKTVVWKKAKVHRDVHVQVDGAFYSVPWRHVTKEVWVRRGPSQLTIHVGEEVVATHARVGRGQRSTVDAHLPEHRGEWRHRAKEHWTAKARAMGEEVERLVEDIFASDDVLSQLRKVQAVVRMLEGYPKERAVRAARRARRFACLDYRGIKSILVQGLDLAPQPDEQQEIEWMKGARYARLPGDVPQPLKEVSNGTEG
jgi:transposase